MAISFIFCVTWVNVGYIAKFIFLTERNKQNKLLFYIYCNCAINYIFNRFAHT